MRVTTKAMTTNNTESPLLTILSQACAIFTGESGKELVHNPLHVSVGQGLLQILKHETESVLFLAGRDLISPVDIEQRDALEELLGGLEGTAIKVSEAHALVKQKGEIPAYLRELGLFLESDLIPLDKLE